MRQLGKHSSSSCAYQLEDRGANSRAYTVNVQEIQNKIHIISAIVKSTQRGKELSYKAKPVPVNAAQHAHAVDAAARRQDRADFDSSIS